MGEDRTGQDYASPPLCPPCLLGLGVFVFGELGNSAELDFSLHFAVCRVSCRGQVDQWCRDTKPVSENPIFVFRFHPVELVWFGC